ncbi:hypothetical protein HA466_0254440 [Hirschfeldia incana]|nr:hypothetical protein HA466_0254440 [Hirschfeldia incana]
MANIPPAVVNAFNLQDHEDVDEETAQILHHSRLDWLSQAEMLEIYEHHDQFEMSHGKYGPAPPIQEGLYFYDAARFRDRYQWTPVPGARRRNCVPGPTIEGQQINYTEARMPVPNGSFRRRNHHHVDDERLCLVHYQIRAPDGGPPVVADEDGDSESDESSEDDSESDDSSEEESEEDGSSEESSSSEDYSDDPDYDPQEGELFVSASVHEVTVSGALALDLIEQVTLFSKGRAHEQPPPDLASYLFKNLGMSLVPSVTTLRARSSAIIPSPTRYLRSKARCSYTGGSISSDFCGAKLRSESLNPLNISSSKPKRGVVTMVIPFSKGSAHEQPPPSVTDLILAEFLYLCINSTGTTKNGEKLEYDTDAFAIYDVMGYVKPPIFTLCVGNAWREAALLLTAGAKGSHSALPSSTVMMKQVKLYSKHIGKSPEQIEADIKRYFSPSEAVEDGIIDKVVYNERISQDKGVQLSRFSAGDTPDVSFDNSPTEERPRRAFERRSGSGRGGDFKREHQEKKVLLCKQLCLFDLQ